MLRIRIRDPGSGAFLTPGSGIRDGQKIKIRIRDEHPESYFRELRNNFFVKIFNFFDEGTLKIGQILKIPVLTWPSFKEGPYPE